MCIWRYASRMSVLKYAMIYVILIEFTIETAENVFMHEVTPIQPNSLSFLVLRA